MTSLESHLGRPAVTPWLRGWIEDDPPQTAIVWRTFLPVRSGGNSAAQKEIEAFFEASPPHASEVLETETFRAVDWLTCRATALQSPTPNVEGDAATLPLRSEQPVAYVLAHDGTLRKTLQLGELPGLCSTLAEATVVVDARLGGLKVDTGRGRTSIKTFGVGRVAQPFPPRFQ